MRMRDKVALITGAAGPMGAAIALRMAAEGADLVMTDISGGRLAEAAAAVSEQSGGAGAIMSHRASVIVEAEANAVFAAAIERFGRVDVLVNVVGGIGSRDLYQPFLDISNERWHGTYEINLAGTRFMTRASAPGMIARRYGRIVNIASTDYAGQWGHADYASSKAAIVSLTRVMAIEFAPHVTVNCIAPGLIRTRALDVIPADKINSRLEATLMRRLGEPSEIADAALFLGSDEASYITGETLRVAGGLWAGL